MLNNLPKVCFATFVSTYLSTLRLMKPRLLAQTSAVLQTGEPFIRRAPSAIAFAMRLYFTLFFRIGILLGAEKTGEARATKTRL